MGLNFNCLLNSWFLCLRGSLIPVKPYKKEAIVFKLHVNMVCWTKVCPAWIHFHTGLNSLIVWQHPIHTDVRVEPHRGITVQSTATESNSVRLYTLPMGLHCTHSSVSPLPHPSFPTCFPLSPHFFPPTSSSSPWRHLHMINDNPCWPLAAIWEHFIWEVAGGIFTHSFSVPRSVFYSTDSSLLRKKTPEGAKIKDTLERRKPVSPHSLLLIALFWRKICSKHE